LNKETMRIIFMGSAEFACPSLESLWKADFVELVGIVCQPERPSGRRLEISKCPVDRYASACNLPVLRPEKVNARENIDALRALKPDLIVVVAYGQILRREILALPPKGCVNLHASLLPKYRGAAPIQWAIANGEKVTGVTAMFMNEKMDAGDIIAREEEQIAPDDTAKTLGRRLCARGSGLLLKTMEMIARDGAPRFRQDEALVTFAPMLKKQDGLLDWNKPAQELENRIRAFQSWPVCFFILNGKKVNVLRGRVEPGCGKEAGALVDARGEGPLIQCGENALRLLEVQPEGKKPMSGSAFLCGNKMAVGEKLA